MMNFKDKSTLWEILVKYDNLKEFKSFCDSISKLIQGTESDDDLLDLISFNENIDMIDLSEIDKVISLTEIVF
jgi:hypothetical protein